MRFLKTTITLLFLISIQLLAHVEEADLNALIEKGKYLEAEKLVENIPANSENIKLWLMKGDVHHELQDYQKAFEAYKKAFEIDDDNIEAIRKFGRAYSMLENYSEARDILEEGIDDYEENIPLRLELASNYIREGELTEAEIQIKRAKDIDEDNPQIYITEGDMYFNQRVYELSKNAYEKALELDANLAEASSKLATSYYWLGNREADQELRNEYFTLSLKEWDKATKIDSMNASAFFNKGKILYLAKNFKNAVPALYRYYELRPEGKLGRWYLAQSLYELGRCDSAAPQLEYVAENIDSVRSEAKLLLARCFYENKDYEKSRDIYKNIIAQDKDVEVTERDRRWYGTSELFSGDTTTALKVYKDLVESNPDGSCNLMNLVGRMMFSSKNYDEALYFFKKRIEVEACKDTTDQKIIYFIGLSHLFNESRDSAITYLNQAIEMDSTDAGSYVYLGDAYSGSGDNEKAVELYNKAIEISLNDTTANKSNLRQAFSKLSGYYYENKDFEKLLEVAMQWSEVQSDIFYGYLYAAVAYQSMGNTEKACEWYKKVLKINPDNKPAQQNMSALNCE